MVVVVVSGDDHMEGDENLKECSDFGMFFGMIPKTLFLIKFNNVKNLKTHVKALERPIESEQLSKRVPPGRLIAPV